MVDGGGSWWVGEGGGIVYSNQKIRQKIRQGN